ncbi:hypothetical protein [Paraburkholderia domus]|uniref:hypothetical protein n=1 Tax=Paraburkholderia domus TaxID=2793075 RepID=UPI001913FA78|nr:hypothetical protein [Paraburkholderia domus]MBK5064855.1 hypothetical protein [Burkholderia sp. R-70199]
MADGLCEAEQYVAEDRLLVGKLRAIAARLADSEGSSDADTVLCSAAHIEGHNEAFRAVVAEKRARDVELRATRTNLEHTLEFVDRWRQLLVALAAEHPHDIRLRRALAGEHPMRVAPWEPQS